MDASISPYSPADDAGWARSFLRALLDHWLDAVDPSGVFHPYFDRTWNRIDREPRTLVSQCRLIYNFSRGYETFHDARYADAAQMGLDGLEVHFGAEHGLYRWAVTAAGTELDATPDAYGHAFCLLAQATAARVFGSSALTARAMQTWRTLSAAFADSYGGLIWRLENVPRRSRSFRSQNPLMHTFEALLALLEVNPAGAAVDGAQRLLTFMRSLEDFDGGLLAERYTQEWNPLQAEGGAKIDLGHQFEWAYLLSEWHELRHEPDALQIGLAFLQNGLEIAMDADGGILTECNSGRRITSSSRGLWQQCEAVRAIHRYAIRHDRSDLVPALERALTFYRRRFVDDKYGGVIASLEEGGHPANTDKGDAWKLDYHSVGMLLELLS